MVEGEERGGGRHPRPSAVIPSDLNHQHAADITTAVAKERTNYVSSRNSEINEIRSDHDVALCVEGRHCVTCFVVVSRPTKCVVDLHE